jgi:tetratricopeptide (TPR) repeat protein
MVLRQGDRARSAQLNIEAITIAQQNDDTLVMVSAMWYLHLVSPQRALELTEREVARQRESGDPERLAAALQYYGYFLLRRGESDRAEDVLRECLTLWQQLDQPFTTVTGTSHTLLSYGLAAQARGDMDQAIIRFNEAAKLYQEVGFVYGVDAVHLLLAYVALSQGRVAQAATTARNCLRRFHERGSLEESVLAISLLAGVAAAQAQSRRSATLFGATTPYAGRLKVQHRQLLGTSLYLIVGDAFERSVAAARTRLDDPDDAAVWEQGARMALDEAVAYALEP